MVTRIDREGRLPIYHQIALSIQHRIANREWEIGDRLPSEMDLAKYYDVSRVTVRQALTELEKDQLVERKRPSGTFVTNRPEKLTPTVSVMVDMLQSLRDSGHTSSIETLSVRLLESNNPTAKELLGMKADEPFVEFQRMVFVNGSPFAWVQTLAPSSRFPGLEEKPLINNSLQETILEHYGAKAARSEHWVEAARATDFDTENLGIEDGELILALSSIFFDQHDLPMAYMTTRWLAEMMRLHLESATTDPFLDVQNS